MDHHRTCTSRVCCSVINVHSSSFRFRFPPGRLPGPQFGVGFCWYRTSFTFEDAVTESGCRLKLASILHKSPSVPPLQTCGRRGTHLGSWLRRRRAGEFSAIFSILTGCDLIHDRKTSWISAYDAVVFSEPAHACEREILCPAWRSAELCSSLPASALSRLLVAHEKDDAVLTRSRPDWGRRSGSGSRPSSA